MQCLAQLGLLHEALEELRSNLKTIRSQKEYVKNQAAKATAQAQEI